MARRRSHYSAWVRTVMSESFDAGRSRRGHGHVQAAVTAAGDRRLHARAPRVGAALAHLAHRRQLGGLPARLPEAAHEDPGHRLRPRHDHRRPGRTGPATGRSPASTGRRASWTRPGPRPPNAAWTTSSSRSRTSTRWTSRTTPSAWSTPIRCSSTSATRCGRCARCGGSPSRADIVAVRDSRLRGHGLVSGVARAWTTGWTCTGGWPAPTAASRTPGRRLKSWALRGRASRTSRRPPARGRFATAEERAWWSGLWADRTLASAYADRATEGGQATAGAAAGGLGGLAGVGTPGGRLVQRAARRDSLPKGPLNRPGMSDPQISGNSECRRFTLWFPFCSSCFWP